jgi:FAD/FMN-containing dehydrogenase
VSVRRTNAFNVLRAAMQGAVLTPEDDGFHSASSPWNRAVRQRPAVVVSAVRADDVVTAVRFVGEHGMPIAVQAAGHGARIPADGALLVGTSALREIEIDPPTRLARIGAGARLLDVVLAAERHGLAMPVGSARTVGCRRLSRPAQTEVTSWPRRILLPNSRTRRSISCSRSPCRRPR